MEPQTPFTFGQLNKIDLQISKNDTLHIGKFSSLQGLKLK
jgi:hypothetical protein